VNSFFYCYSIEKGHNFFFFSRMRRRTAHQYIKKNEKGGKEPPKTKLLQDWEGL